MPQNNKVWLVSYINWTIKDISDYASGDVFAPSISYTVKAEPAVVTVFNNKKVAEKCYEHFKKKYGTVRIDEAPICSVFNN